jgi:Lipase (class 3)
MFVASEVAAAQIWSMDSTMFNALDAVEPGDHTVFPNTLLVPSVAFSVTDDYLFIAVQGTNGWAQWAGNVLGSAQTIYPGFIAGQVSTYFGAVALFIYTVYLTSFTSYFGSKKVVLIGHSLGGAVCDILAAAILLHFPGTELVVFTLGAPRAGDATFAGSISARVHRCENTDDPIPSLPPPVWLPSSFTGWFPPPPSPGFYTHPGDVYTFNYDGSSFGDHTEIPFVVVLAYFAQMSMPAHLAPEYTRRLAIGLGDLSFPDAGYANPALLKRSFFDLFPGSGSGGGLFSLEGETMNKFTLFYNIGSRAGLTESFYSNAASASWSSIISDYLQGRMALADSYFLFKYCRISSVPSNRKVSWRAPSDVSPTSGTYGNTGDSAPEQALLLRMTMVDGSDNRIFLHGMPSIVWNGENYTPSSGFTTAVNRFVATLSNGNYLYRDNAGHTVADRVPIAAFSPNPPRGTVLTLGESVSLSPGARLYIGGSGNKIVGLNGLKIVNAVASPTSVTIGGATPVGEPADLSTGCFLYVENYSYQVPSFADVESLTTHRVGRPFGVRPGRRHNTVSLR